MIDEDIVERPWGEFNNIYERWDGDICYKIKQITVNPGCSISLQSHKHRDELWKIIKGEGEVIIDGAVYPARPFPISDSYFVIRKEIQHRITNTEQEPLVFIEVQTGDSFAEDDIIRFADEYGRV